MAYIKRCMTSRDGKIVYCTCEHHKARVPSRREHMEVGVPWDEDMESEAKKEAENGGASPKL